MIIDFEYRRKGDVKRAFEYSERSHGRSLRDLISTNVKIVDNPPSPDVKFAQVSQASRLEEIQLGIPEDTQILQYSVLKRSILLWVLSKNAFNSASVDISSDDLDRHVNRFLHLVTKTSLDDLAEFTDEADYLYDLLIKPVEHLLDRDKQLCIVPRQDSQLSSIRRVESESIERVFHRAKEARLCSRTKFIPVCDVFASRSSQALNGRGAIIDCWQPAY